VVPCWNKIILGRTTDGGGSGLKFFKIILFWHGTKALYTEAVRSVNGQREQNALRHCSNQQLLSKLRPKNLETSGQSNLTTDRIAAAHGRYSLYFTMRCPFLIKIAPFHGGSGLHLYTWFLEPTQARNPNGISISSSVFAGLRAVTDRQTDHAIRSVTIGRT